MSQRFREKAASFAREWGWDGVFPQNDSAFWMDSIPEGYEAYEAAFCDSSAGDKNWTPMFDNAPHVIIASEDDVRWRTVEDCVDMRGVVA